MEENRCEKLTVKQVVGK